MLHRRILSTCRSICSCGLFPDEAGHVLHRIAQEAADLVGEPFFQAGPALQPGEHRVHPLCDGIAKPDKAILDVWAAELLF